MKSLVPFNLIRAIFLLLLLPVALQAQYRNHDVGQMDPAMAGRPASTSLVFAGNLGQWPSQVRFAAQMKGVDLWVTDSSVLYDLHTITHLDNPSTGHVADPAEARRQSSTLRRGHLIHMRFAGALNSAAAQGTRKAPGYHNYFLGNDPARWATHVPLFQETRIRDLYPGISLLLHFEDGLPRYDFILEPNADPDLIKLQFDGADNLSITSSGELAIGTSLGVVRQQRLFAYQMVNGKKRSVPCSFRMMKDGTVGFDLGRYDARLPLVIDPIVYSTFLGGSGDDNAIALAVDGNGNTCVTGYAGAPSSLGLKFPTTSGAYSQVDKGQSDVFVSKFYAAGGLMFSTLVSGSSYEDGRDIGVDATGNIYVTGFTGSSDFPTTTGAFNTTFNGGTHDVFVLKLSPDGANLLYSTFVGGSHSDAAYGLTVEPTGQVHVTGSTFSGNFPTSANAYDRTLNGESDIMTFALAPNGATLSSSTYIGGADVDYAYAIKRNAATGRIYIIGTSSSSDFPTTANAALKQARGGYDAVVVQLSTDRSRLEYSTYVGGSSNDYGQDIIVDQDGEMIICGYTASFNFPIAGDAFETTYGGGSYDGFVTKITWQGDRFEYSSFIGGSGEDYAMSLAQYQQRYWIGGSTGSTDFRYTLAVPDSSYNGNQDGFVMLLDLATDSLHYSTFVGGSSRDVLQDIAYELRGRRLHICGMTISENYPVTQNAHQRTLAPKLGQGSPSYDAFFMKVETTVIILLTETPGDELMLCPNSNFEIRWASFDLDRIRITLYRQRGERFFSELFSDGPASTGVWPWKVSGNHPPGTDFRIRIEGNDGLAGLYGSDTGSRDFTVIEEPRLIRGITSKEVCPGEKVDFSLEAEGYNIAYIWRHNGFTVFGATRPSHIIDSMTTADTGTYEGVVYDACGSIALTQTVKLTLKPVPAIVQQPVDMRACAGQPVTLSIGAAGDDLRYQWFKDGARVHGATSAELKFDQITLDDDGYYTCHVMNAVCAQSPVPSMRARLRVVYEKIVEQPRNQTAKVGESVSFYVLAFGADPTYQWRKDGKDIPGATISTYSIPYVRPSDAGYYDVIIRGECEMTSIPALLNVSGFSAVTGERHESASSLIMIQPNPVSTRGFIRIDAGAAALRNSELALYDVLGRRVMDLTANLRASMGQAIEFDTDALAPGIYYCRLFGEGWSHTSPMIVVEK